MPTNQTMVLIDARARPGRMPRRRSPTTRNGHPAHRDAGPDGRQHDAVLDHRDRRPGPQGHPCRDCDTSRSSPGAPGCCSSWPTCRSGWTVRRAGVDRLEGVPHGVTRVRRPHARLLQRPRRRSERVIAAESLGIGSCYIGDILERGETHAELLHLPRYTFPVTMLCLVGQEPAAHRRALREAGGPQERLSPPERRGAPPRRWMTSTALRRARLWRLGQLRAGDLRPQVRL